MLVVVCVLLGLFDPEMLEVLEGFGVVYVAYKDDCVGAFVVGFGDAPESLLSCGVPDL